MAIILHIFYVSVNDNRSKFTTAGIKVWNFFISLFLHLFLYDRQIWTWKDAVDPLTQCGLVMLYGNRDLGQHWSRWWLVAWCHRAIIWTSVDLSWTVFCGIHLMMTSSNGNVFHVTGPLCREFTCLWWIPCTKASDAELWCFLWSAPECMVE